MCIYRTMTTTDVAAVPTTDSDEVALATSYVPTTPQLKLVSLLATGMAADKARRKLRISIQTMELWSMKPAYRAWRDSILAAEARQHVGEVRQALLSKAKSGDVKAMELYLSAFDKEFKKKESPASQRNYYTQIINQANKSA